MGNIPKPLNEYDLHFVFHGPSRVLKCFDAQGKLRWKVSCRNDTVSADAKSRYFGHHGHCPPGEYRFAHANKLDVPKPEFGFWWITIIDEFGAMKAYGRDWIGAHGGGTGLRDSFADSQGWVVTLGCLRLQNKDIERLANSVNYTYSKNGIPWLSVVWD